MKRPFAATVWREGRWYVSQCLELDVASQGDTEEEALANLKEAIELHFEPPRATRPPQDTWQGSPAAHTSPSGPLLDSHRRSVSVDTYRSTRPTIVLIPKKM